ncbi:YfiR family protein [Candidatus Albibeggiatoa sp. nov. BB20]|uniref:YfiR family protein n=1 Tax=Candidatus Albibeggiatoa sp. nov. BB20 TaxID=3162723 RepID=UPI0033655919
MLYFYDPPINKYFLVKYGFVLFSATLFYFSLFNLAIASQPNIRESEIKAVYLFNFSLFTSWPANSDSNAGNFNICVLGDDPFGNNLDIAVANETVSDRPVVVRRILHYKNTDFCQILYISQSEQPKLKKIMTHLEGKPILTVSDIPSFVVNGGMIEFYRRKTKVRFFVDPKTVVDAGLKISSKLLRVAKVVQH